MSISMTKAEGTTVITLTTDRQSTWPPLCQILKALCYNPLCCKASPTLRRALQGSSQSVLGTLQIMIGLLNIGLGIILRVSDFYMYPLNSTLFPVWLGILFIIFGTVSIVSQKHPVPCLGILNAILNLAGVAFAVTAVTLYGIVVGNIYMWRDCSPYSYYYSSTEPPLSEKSRRVQEACLAYRASVLMLLRSIVSVLIVLSTLQLCVSISASVLGIKALKKAGNKDDKGTEDPEDYKPLLENVNPDSLA